MRSIGITPEEKRFTWSGDPEEIPEDWPPTELGDDSQNIQTCLEQKVKIYI